MKQKLQNLLVILNPIMRFLTIAAVMLLPFVQFICAAAYGLSDSGESELHTTMAQYSFHLLLVTGPCLYGLALYMLRDLRAMLPDKAFFAASEKVLRWALRILLGISCFILTAFIIVTGVVYLL